MNKVFKLSWAGVLSLSLVAVLFSCQKDASDPLLTSAAKGGGTVTPREPVFDLLLPENDFTCETSTSYCFNTALLNHGGQTIGGKTTIYATISGASISELLTSGTLSANQGSVCFSDIDLNPGSYTVTVYFEHVPNENATPQYGSFSFNLTVRPQDQCETSTCESTGLTFSRDPVKLELDQYLSVVTVNVTYVVKNCSTNDTYNNLKIQGGLVNKAGVPTLSKEGTTGTIISFDKKKVSGNYIITGYFNLAPSEVAKFNVVYNVDNGCNNYLTGEWSVKNGPVPVISEDLTTASSEYYINRLRSVCP